MTETFTEPSTSKVIEKSEPEYPHNWAEEIIALIRRSIRLPHDGSHRMILTQMETMTGDQEKVKQKMNQLLTPFREESIHVIGVYSQEECPQKALMVSEPVDHHLFSSVRFTTLPLPTSYPKSVLLLDPNGSLRVTFRYQKDQFRRVEEVLKLIRKLKYR